MFGSLAMLLAQEAAKPAVTPELRVKALAGMAAVCVLAGGLLMVVWMVGRSFRNYRNASDDRMSLRAELEADDWARKSLRDAQDEEG